MTTAQQAFNAPEELLPDELFQRDSSLTADADKMTRPSLSYWSDAWRRFKENKVAVISSAILLVIVLMALIQPMFSRYAYSPMCCPGRRFSCASCSSPGMCAALRRSSAVCCPSSTRCFPRSIPFRSRRRWQKWATAPTRCVCRSPRWRKEAGPSF